MRVLVALIALGVLAGCATGSAGNSSAQVSEPQPVSRDSGTYFLKLAGEGPAVFYGQPKPDTVAGSTGSGMMYPGNNAATFLAAIMTHAVIAKSIDEKKKNDAIKTANAVLEPYQPMIDSLSTLSLQEYFVFQADHDVEPQYAFADSAAMLDSDGWYTTVNPVYVLSYSEDAISVRAEVNVYERHGGEDVADLSPMYTRTLHLQSALLPEQSMLLDSEGDLFKQTVHGLMRDLVALAIDDFAGVLPQPVDSIETIRYLDNRAKTVERGRIIDSDCQFILFESLRDEIKRMQTFTKTVDPTCRAISP